MGGARGGAVAAAAAAVSARAVLAQPGLFPQDDIIPSGELMRASGTWMFTLIGRRVLKFWLAFQIRFLAVCFPVITSPCSCPTLAKTGSLTCNSLVCCVLVCFLGHLHVCCSDCYAAQCLCLQTPTFLDKASFSFEIETLKTTSQNSSKAEELLSFHCTFSIVPRLVG